MWEVIAVSVIIQITTQVIKLADDARENAERERRRVEFELEKSRKAAQTANEVYRCKTLIAHHEGLISTREITIQWLQNASSSILALDEALSGSVRKYYELEERWENVGRKRRTSKREKIKLEMQELANLLYFTLVPKLESLVADYDNYKVRLNEVENELKTTQDQVKILSDKLNIQWIPQASRLTFNGPNLKRSSVINRKYDVVEVKLNESANLTLTLSRKSE